MSDVRRLSDIPIIEVDNFYAVVVRQWRSLINETTVRWIGKPLRPHCEDLWILTTSSEDATILARLVQRDLQPEDRTEARRRYVTTKRMPTFAPVLGSVPEDVACYLSGTSRVNDHAILQRLHPAAPRVNERISWDKGTYRLQSEHGWFWRELPSDPRTFAQSLSDAREELVREVGLGYDTAVAYPNASPVLANLLQRLTRPAAEAVSHWMRGLGKERVSSFVLPELAFTTGLPIARLELSSPADNMRASFVLCVKGLELTDMELSGLEIPDSMGVALNALAQKGTLRLSQIVDLPGAEDIPVLSLTARGSTWTAHLDPVSVPISPPMSDIPFDAAEGIRRIEDEGYQVAGDAASVLSAMGKERAAFILYCVDAAGSPSFDISPWTHQGAKVDVYLWNRAFSLRSSQLASPLSFLASLA
ncbi:hypothetical protein [Sphingomonas sp. 3-13AW]|uniref:hypothetical protein n=1 Tax=Sphingomonas sp. 3-13AW TaxID=3050450 RepID=UPI003BB56684